MNIRERCPCGQDITLDRLSTNPDHDISVPLQLLEDWRRSHSAHRRSTLDARLRQIDESRWQPAIVVNDPEVASQLAGLDLIPKEPEKQP